jgi:hypothetical protein
MELHLVLQRRAARVEEASGLRLIAVGAAKGILDERSLVARSSAT